MEANLDVGSRGSRNNHFLLKIFWEICQLWGPSVLDVQLQKPLFAKLPANFVCSSVQQHTFWQKKCNTRPVHLSCSDNYFYNIRHRRHLCISESILQDWWMLFTLICFLFLKKIKKWPSYWFPKQYWPFLIIRENSCLYGEMQKHVLSGVHVHPSESHYASPSFICTLENKDFGG